MKFKQKTWHFWSQLRICLYSRNWLESSTKKTYEEEEEEEEDEEEEEEDYDYQKLSFIRRFWQGNVICIRK